MSKIIEHNATTGQIIERDLTDDELLQIEKDKSAAKLEAKRQADLNAEKAALLAKLGITDDEAKLLLS